MRSFSLICIVLVAFVVIADAKSVHHTSKKSGSKMPAETTPDATPETTLAATIVTSNLVTVADQGRVGKGIQQIVKGSVNGAKDITGGALGGAGGGGGILSGIGKIIHGALAGAGNIVGGVLG